MAKNIEKELLDITSKLVSFRTTEDRPEEVDRLYKYIRGCLEGAGVNIVEFEKEGKKSLVIFRGDNPKRKHFKTILLCHVDVVPAGEKLFVPRVEKGRLYGRGAYDMKSGCAVALALIRNISSEDFAVIYTSDEEIGGKKGTSFLVDKGYRADFVIALESTDLAVIYERKGVVRLVVEAKGKSVHSSTPWDGINALDKLIAVYLDVKKHFTVITAKSSDNAKFNKTLNLALMKGGDVFNKIPDDAYMYLDVRYPKKDDPEEIITTVRKAAKKHKCTLKSAWVTPTLFTDKKNPHLQRLAKIGGCELKRRYGASDCRYFSEIGVAAVDFGAKGYGHHGDGEYLEIKSLKKVYAVLDKFLSG